jgi:hypothetical protein
MTFEIVYLASLMGHGSLDSLGPMALHSMHRKGNGAR